MDSEQEFFDNRKAGKPTPRTRCGLRSAKGSEGVGYYKFCSRLSITVEQGDLFKPQWLVTSGEWRDGKFRNAIRSKLQVAAEAEDCGVESLQRKS